MPAILKKLARLFRGLTLREQILSLLFIVALLLIWTSNFLNRVEATRDQYRAARAHLSARRQHQQ